MKSPFSEGCHRKAHIASVAIAVPPYRVDQAAAEAFFTSHFSERLNPRNMALMKRILSHPSIRGRNFAFEDPSSLLDEDPDYRIARFTKWALELSCRAASDALEGAGLGPADISGLVVNTCTGYICPGLSTYLIEKMGLPDTVDAYDLVGGGCGGAIPNLQISGSRLARDGRAVLSISVEICSATFQMGDDLSLILSNALFADGAAAAVISEKADGFQLVDSASRYATEHRDHIRYVHRKGQLHNRITTRLPHFVKHAVRKAVGDILGRHSLAPGDIQHWALHNGGETIIKEVSAELGLEDHHLRHTRDVLSQFGNMSSPTVWFVLRKIMDAGVKRGDLCMMVAFGAGLSAHAALLKKV